MIRCVRFRAYRKNTLQGFADLQLVRTGIVIKDCALHERGGRWWISFPARSYQVDGRTQWAALIEFADGADEARETFQRLAVAAVRAFADKQAHSGARHDAA
jgi:hypothetical protein